MSSDPISWREALSAATLGALATGAALPAAALLLSPDQLLATESPAATALWSLTVGAWLCFVWLGPLCLLATRFHATQHLPRVLMLAAPLLPVVLGSWFFGARTGRADGPTLALGLLWAAVAVALSAGIGRALASIDPALRRAWPVVGALVLLPTTALLPRGPTPLPAPVAPSLADHQPPEAALDLPSRPNLVLLLTVDTLRADHLGAWGYRRATTPVLDALAADSLILRDLTAAASGTVPSFGTVHTGHFPECTGVTHQLSSLGDPATTLAERFADAGYRTAAVVSNHNLDAAHGFTQGFEHFENLGESGATAVVDASIAALGAISEDQPLFAWVHLFDPHTPYVQPADAFRDDPLWTDEPVPLVDFGSWGGIHRTRTTGEALPGHTVNLAEITARYDAEIAHTDEQIGRLLVWLDHAGRLDDTVILFTADHGETLYRSPRDAAAQHALQVYADDLHVPGFLWGPGRVPRGSIDAPTRHIDLVPTLLHATRLNGDLSLPGADLLRAGPRSTAATARSAWWDAASLRLIPLTGRAPSRSISHDGWKLVLHPHRALAELSGPLGWFDAWRSLWSGIAQDDQLFHIAVDPLERTDRIREQPERASALRAHLAYELQRGVPEDCTAIRGTEVDLDAETREQLRAMGYLD